MCMLQNLWWNQRAQTPYSRNALEFGEINSGFRAGSSDSRQLFKSERNEDHTRRGNIPQSSIFIYPLNSKTFNLGVWHFIITHLDWHGLTHVVLSGYTRTIAKELQKINPWFLNNCNQKKKSYRYQNFRCIALKRRFVHVII